MPMLENCKEMFGQSHNCDDDDDDHSMSLTYFTFTFPCLLYGFVSDGQSVVTRSEQHATDSPSALTLACPPLTLPDLIASYSTILSGEFYFPTNLNFYFWLPLDSFFKWNIYLSWITIHRESINFSSDYSIPRNQGRLTSINPIQKLNLEYIGDSRM